jgi:23S rRNA (uracil1939-C5)-methyltransferase
VNRFLIDELVASVVGAEMQGDLALDLFCGVGLFTLPLTKCFQRVVGVESNPAAVRDLQFNLTANARRAEIRNSGVDDFLRKSAEPPQLVIMDPPRAGLTSESLSRLIRLRPERITYVSCEPSTLARDLAALSTSAYAVKEVHLFDLFPQTFHIETVVKLARR